MLVLPIYPDFSLGSDAAGLVQVEPFVHAFVWVITVPFAFAAVIQLWTARNRTGERVSTAFGLLSVPATALVLFVVIAAVVPQPGPAKHTIPGVVLIYIAFAVLAPLIGWSVARLFRLGAPEIALLPKPPAGRCRGCGLLSRLLPGAALPLPFQFRVIRENLADRAPAYVEHPADLADACPGLS